MSSFSIELDCPPGSVRPGDLLPAVLAGTGLDLGEPVAKCFGNWTWVIPDDQVDQFRENRETIKQRIVALYNVGAIRYGSW